MSLYRHLVQLFIVLVFCSSCISSTSGDQLFINDDQLHSLKYETETFDLSRLYDQVGLPAGSPYMVNVDDFGAKGDGTDDSEAFRKAWEEVCSYNNSVLVVPEDRIYHLKPINFSGPCNSHISMKIDGTIKASVNPWDYEHSPQHWLLFQNLRNFEVKVVEPSSEMGRYGGKNLAKSTKAEYSCTDAPTAATFLGCKNLKVSGLRVRNPQQVHISFQKCVNVKARNLIIVAPGNSPNTDGIHVTGTQNIQIMNSIIKTGDDCISIVSGSKNIKVTDITCGPGHGISIGSLGKGNSDARVLDVSVNRVRFSGSTNGVRIKTWQGGSGFAKNIKFQDVLMHNVSNPIIIDQNYCDQIKPCTKQPSAVQVENVWYKNIRGTSASKVAIQLNCSKSLPCKGIVLQDIILAAAQTDQNAIASCDNVYLASRGRVSPPCSESE
ncbi:hypothetical protein LOK49_LG02G01429 [Camellia lanceoleosa]|uniref:Uncharacterized protein n=1 Tax=Camellia lanceoleosa TaxID=1840588 RepID=A0ACC0IQT4_9ERIC|nr:hypothetical protein LOK49_LG02G01429 [Camellia lanceoleosa]